MHLLYVVFELAVLRFELVHLLFVALLKELVELLIDGEHFHFHSLEIACRFNVSADDVAAFRLVSVDVIGFSNNLGLG